MGGGGEVCFGSSLDLNLTQQSDIFQVLTEKENPQLRILYCGGNILQKQRKTKQATTIHVLE